MPTKFGEQVTGDHFINGGREDEEDHNFPCDTVAVVLYDRGTRFLAVYPKSAKDTANTVAAMQHFAGPRDKVQSFYCDNAPELISAATSLKWRLGTATTGMPQTNGVAENCVRRCKEGGGCAIVQSGLNPSKFWPYAGEHFCFANNIAIVNGDSAWNKRHKKGRFKGMQIPYGALVDFMSQPDVKVASMGPKTIPGIFIGYHVNPGWEWSGDYLVAGLDYFRSDPEFARSKVKIHRIKEVVPNPDGKFLFPVAVWRQERLLKADHFNVPAEVEEVHESDDIEALPLDDPLPAGIGSGSSGDYGATWVPGSVPPYPTAPFYGLPPGTDVRGMGLESFDGRGRAAKSATANRPPTIPPELWQKTSPNGKKDAIKDYLAQLAADKAAHAIIAAPCSWTYYGATWGVHDRLAGERAHDRLAGEPPHRRRHS